MIVSNYIEEGNIVIYVCKCNLCGKQYETDKQRMIKFCSYDCMKLYYNRLNAETNYKLNDPDLILLNLVKNNGFNITTEGYIRISKPKHKYCTSSGQILEHRVVMEQKLNRLLDPNEAVHHIDGDTENNDPDNLEVFINNAEHLKHHATMRSKAL